MLSYAEEFIKFTFKGEVIQLSFPRSKDQKKYEEDVVKMISGKSKTSYFDIQKKYLTGLGMSEKVCDDLQQKHKTELLEYLNGQKKILK